MDTKPLPFISNIQLGNAQILSQQLETFTAGVPFSAFGYIQVIFPAANTDYDVIHNLLPPTFEDIDYQVVRKDRVCDVYNDTSGTRRAWGSGYITLRCDTAGAVVTLLLTIRSSI